MAEFNLVDEPWIPCVDLQGQRVEHGICATFLNAHGLREICDDSPLVTVAIHRLLLAILYRAYRGPEDMLKWRLLYERNHFISGGETDIYLSSWHKKFNLFDEEYPFMQVSGLDLNDYNLDGTILRDKTDGLMRLVREAPDKGGRILFDHRVGTERPKYEPKQIAKMILSAQSFSSTGIALTGMVRNKQIAPTPCQFAPCVDGGVLWLQGKNLFQTLLLNLVPRDYVIGDEPAWEDDSIVDKAIESWKKTVTFTGPVQRFAPLSRSILILDSRSMFFTNGLKADSNLEDPMKFFSRPDEKKEYQPLKIHKNKASWRDAHALFSLKSSESKLPASLNHIARLTSIGVFTKTSRPIANIVGLATDKGKTDLWRHERMPIPLGILVSDDLSERIGLLLKEAEAIGGDIGGELSRGLYSSSIAKKTTRKEPVGRIQAIADLVLNPLLEIKRPGVLRTKEGKKPGEAHNKASLELSKELDPRPAYWTRMEEHFFDLLENLTNDWDITTDDWKPDADQEATNTWRNQIKKEAQQALEESIRSLGTTARAIQAIARVRTDFNDNDLKPLPQKDARTKRKKKGGKK